MGTLVRYLDNATNCWSRVNLPSGEPIWISVARTGVVIKVSRLGLFGPKIFEESDHSKVALICQALAAQTGEGSDLPPDIRNPVLRLTTSQALRSSSAVELVAQLAAGRSLAGSDYAWEQAGTATTDTPESATMTLTDAEQIVAAYGALLESEPPGAETVDDVGRLPFEKPIIEAALWKCLRHYPRTELADNLQFGLLSLAHYQPDVGEVRVGIEWRKLDPITDRETQHRLIRERTTAYKQWEATVDAEKRTRMKALRTAGFP